MGLNKKINRRKKADKRAAIVPKGAYGGIERPKMAGYLTHLKLDPLPYAQGQDLDH